MSTGAIWVGADPGGRNAFGVAVLMDDGKVSASTVDCADEAVAFVRSRCLDRPPVGAGVDAPLWWSSGLSGDRHADQWLRKRYGLAGGEVQAPNSLRGAALTQGAMFVFRMRELFPGLPVTESHPKALLKAISDNRFAKFAAQFQLGATLSDEHARDAVIGAVAAREAFEGRWTHDLADSRLVGELDPNLYWLAPVHYFWPEM